MNIYPKIREYTRAVNFVVNSSTRLVVTRSGFKLYLVAHTSLFILLLCYLSSGLSEFICIVEFIVHVLICLLRLYLPFRLNLIKYWFWNHTVS